MLIKTKGIVLRRLNYSESSLILDIFTEDHGLMSYIISGIRKPGARTGASVLQLMSIVELVAYHSDKRKLLRIREARPAYVYKSIPGDARKNAILLFLAELCNKVIRETEASPQLYQLMEEELLKLDAAESQIGDLHLGFMVRFADQLGFGPDIQREAGEEIFDLQEGRFVRQIPHHEYYLKPAGPFCDLVTAVRQGIPLPVTDRISRNQMLDTLLLYFQLHVDQLREMQSHHVLRAIL